MLLYEKLRELGISYQSEEDLRAAGFSKTPDVKLDAPIGVRGRMVNWIDSKASFGDEHIHKAQGSDQFQRFFCASQIADFSSFPVLLLCSYHSRFCRINVMICNVVIHATI